MKWLKLIARLITANGIVFPAKTESMNAKESFCILAASIVIALILKQKREEKMGIMLIAKQGLVEQ